MPSNRIRLRIDMTSDQAVDFVQRLAADESQDDFRARLTESPAEVLWEYGIEASPSLIAGPIELPSRDEMQDLLNTVAKGEPVTVAATATRLFPIFCGIFPHIGLAPRAE